MKIHWKLVLDHLGIKSKCSVRKIKITWLSQLGLFEIIFFARFILLDDDLALFEYTQSKTDDDSCEFEKARLWKLIFFGEK